MAAVFGKVTPEWSTSQPAQPAQPFLFLFLARGLDENPCALWVTASDFNSNTFQIIKSRQELEDMRDDIGIGGSWSEFMDYMMTSLRSSDVKLTLEGSSESGGASRARLIAQKAKGLPRISFSLCKLVDGAAGEAMSKLSLELYNDYRDLKSSLTKVVVTFFIYVFESSEQVSNYQLTKVVAAEKEKSDSLQKQLDMVLYSRKGKSQKINGTDIPDSTSIVASQNSPDKKAAHNPGPTKVNRVVPAFRRSKVRGVVLEDTEDDAQN